MWPLVMVAILEVCSRARRFNICQVNIYNLHAVWLWWWWLFGVDMLICGYVVNLFIINELLNMNNFYKRTSNSMHTPNKIFIVVLLYIHIHTRPYSQTPGIVANSHVSSQIEEIVKMCILRQELL